MESNETRRIEGGFVLLRACELLAAWDTVTSGAVRLVDIRVYLVCREMVARREAAPRKAEARYGIEELQSLVQGPGGAVLRASLRRLERAGLLRWEPGRIAFLRIAVGSGAGCGERRLVPFPRRMLRFVAQRGTSRATLAAVFGHLLRCVFYKRGVITATGCCKASWVAQRFGVNERSVKRARAELVRMGWLRQLPTSQWRLNRFGGRFEVNLAWSKPHGEGRVSTACVSPPRAQSTAQLSPPVPDKEPLREYKNQEPGTAGPAGVQGNGKATLRNVTLDDLRSVKRLRLLHAQACERGWSRAGEAGLLAFVAMAEHALRCGSRNPPGMFRWLVENRRQEFVTQEDEAAAGTRSLCAGFAGGGLPDGLSSIVERLSADLTLAHTSPSSPNNRFRSREPVSESAWISDRKPSPYVASGPMRSAER